MPSLGLGLGLSKNKTAVFTRGGGLTPRTEEFITATAITDSTIISALNTMDLALIGAGLLPSGVGAGKIKVLYPFVGGTATTHKYNFVDPRDLDAAFRLGFSGGFTHDANGITPNGINGFADTYISGTNLTNNNTSWSIYSRSDITDDSIDIGGANGSGKGVYCFTKRSVGNGGFLSYLYENVLGFSAMPASTKLIGASRTSNVLNKSYREGSALATSATANTYDVTTLATKIVLCAYRAGVGGTPILYSARNLAFAHIGQGFSDAEFADFNTIIEAFQTTLGRNV